QERRTRALLAAEADRPVDESLDEPLEPDRDLDQPPSEPRRHAIDRAAADDRLADGDRSRPVGAIGEEVADRDGEVMVRHEEPRTMAHDAVAIGIGVAREG